MLRLSHAAYMAIAVGFARKTLAKISSPPARRDRSRIVAERVSQAIIDALNGKYSKVTIKPLTQAEVEAAFARWPTTPVIRADCTETRTVDRVVLRARIEPIN